MKKVLKKNHSNQQLWKKTQIRFKMNIFKIIIQLHLQHLGEKRLSEHKVQLVIETPQAPAL